MLFMQGDPMTEVFLVLEGRVRAVLLTRGGQEMHLAIVGTNGLIGESGAFIDGRHSITAIASSNLLVCVFHIKELRASVEVDGTTRGQLLALMDSKLRIFAEHHVLLAHATAGQRVAHHLLDLANTFGRSTSEGVALNIDFTHGEMACIAGLSRVMVSTLLAQWQRDGLLRKVSGWVITDLDALRKLAATT